MARPPTRPIVNRTNYELARDLVDEAPALLELYRRWLAEEERLTAALGPDDPITFADFVAWVVERGSRPPHRPRGRPERASARLNRSAAARRRHQRARELRLAESRSQDAAA